MTSWAGVEAWLSLYSAEIGGCFPALTKGDWAFGVLKAGRILVSHRTFRVSVQAVPSGRVNFWIAGFRIQFRCNTAGAPRLSWSSRQYRGGH